MFISAIPLENKTKSDTVTGGSLLVSVALPPASVTKFPPVILLGIKSSKLGQQAKQQSCILPPSYPQILAEACKVK